MSTSPEADPPAYWTVIALKFDRSLHYRLYAHLVQHQDGCLHLRVEPGYRLEHVTRSFVRGMSHPSELYFWRGRWYNVYANLNHQQQLDHFYCNIGLPPEIHPARRIVAFVDLDLDVQIWTDGRWALLDEDEFAEHAAHYGYPPVLQASARRAVEEVLAHWRGRAAPFGDYPFADSASP